MVDSDIPKFTDHEIRALLYIYETENQVKDNKSLSITRLSELTGWESKYYTRAWKRLQPRNLLNRSKEGRNTVLELTDKGREVASKLIEINEVLDK